MFYVSLPEGKVILFNGGLSGSMGNPKKSATIGTTEVFGTLLMWQEHSQCVCRAV